MKEISMVTSCWYGDTYNALHSKKERKRERNKEKERKKERYIDRVPYFHQQLKSYFR